MAKGDSVIGPLTSIAAAASLTIRPDAGIIWLLRSLAYGGQVEVYLTDGTNNILIDSDGAAGQSNNINTLISNAQYVTVKNIGTSAIYIRFDAVIWS